MTMSVLFCLSPAGHSQLGLVVVVRFLHPQVCLLFLVESSDRTELSSNFKMQSLASVLTEHADTFLPHLANTHKHELPVMACD